jgi:hypothetical protein
MVNNRHNYVNLFPSIDAIEEFKVQTGNYSAEYGGNAGTNVNIQIKSGSNKFHGNLFEYIRNEALDARNYFAPAPAPKNILKQNQFGATFGGHSGSAGRRFFRHQHADHRSRDRHSICRQHYSQRSNQHGVAEHHRSIHAVAEPPVGGSVRSDQLCRLLWR